MEENCSEFITKKSINDSLLEIFPGYVFNDVYSIISFPNTQPEDINLLRGNMYQSGWIGYNTTESDVMSFVQSFEYGELMIISTYTESSMNSEI